MTKIMIGWSEQSIVPEGRKVSLVGQFYERISDVVETPITVTALAISCGEEAAIFCSCDLVSVPSRLIKRAREILLAKDPAFPVYKPDRRGIIARINAEIELIFHRGWPLPRRTRRGECRLRMHALPHHHML